MAMNPAQAAQNIKSRIDKLDPSVPQDNEDSIVPFAEEILAQVGDPDGEGGYTIKSEDVYFNSSSTNLLQEGTVKFVLESVDSYLESYAEDIGANNGNLQSHLSSTAAHAASAITVDSTFDPQLTATDSQVLFEQIKGVVDENLGVLVEIPYTYYDPNHQELSVTVTWGDVAGNWRDQTDLAAAVDSKVDKVVGKGLSTEDYTTVEKNKLNSIETNAETNVQADWDVADATSDAFIKNKPTLEITNWNTAFGWGDHSLAGYAKSSSLATVATSGAYSDLSGTPNLEAANISYDNTTSGLTATDVKNAIDEAVATSSSSLQTHIDNTEAHAASDITTDPSFDADVSSTDVQAMFQEFKSIMDSNVGVLAELP